MNLTQEHNTKVENEARLWLARLVRPILDLPIEDGAADDHSWFGAQVVVQLAYCSQGHQA